MRPAAERRVQRENAISASGSVLLGSESSRSTNRETDTSRRRIAWPKRSCAEGIAGRNAISSLGQGGGALQRDEPKTPPKPNNYDDAISKILDALKETPVAKELQAKAAEMGKDFDDTVEGKVIIGSSLGGALAAIIATNSKLPMQIPQSCRSISSRRD